MRRPMEPTGALANLSHDLLNALHRFVFHRPHHHQQAQRRVHVTPHAIANSPSFEGETSRLLPIAIQRCSLVNGTESGTRKRPWSPRLGSGEPIRACVRGETLKALGGSLQEVFGRPQASRQQGTTSIRSASLCEQDLDTPFHRVWECQLLEVAEGEKNLIRSRCGMQRHEAAHCSASHPVERTVPSERHFRIGHVATTPRTLVPAQVPDCFVSSSESSSVTQVLVRKLMACGWWLVFGPNVHVGTKADEHHWTNWMQASQPFCRWTASCTATT